MKKIFFCAIIILSASAMADFSLSKNGKSVVCYGEDNQSWVLNAKRTSIEYTIEGEGIGPQKINNRQSDDKSFASYTTSEGTLTLSESGDSFQFSGDEEAQGITCK